MKKSFIYIIALQIILLFTACNRDDLYVDPSNPLKVTPATLLTALEVNTFMTYEGEFARTASIFTQQMAGCGGQYSEFQDYTVFENSFSNNWEALYTTMYNAKLLETQYSEDRPYYLGLSKVIMAMNLGVATDLWGDVAYSDAFKAESGEFESKYDSQEQILNSIQQLLSDAITELSKPADENVFVPGTDDLIFKGDIKNWITASWILKARYANRLSLKNPAGSANEVLTFLANAKTAGGSLAMEAPHYSAMLNQWADFQGQRGGYMVANKYFMDILKTADDPRLPYYFSKYIEIDPVTKDTLVNEYRGADIQLESVSSKASIINMADGNAYFQGERSFPLIAESEFYFLSAEAKARLGQDASGDLNDAIKSSISDVTDGEDDGASMATYTTATATIENIMIEKWKAMFGQIEPYNDYRRTGYPNLTPRSESAGASMAFIPKSLTTPIAERLYNQYAVIHGADAPVWWATN